MPLESHHKISSNNKKLRSSWEKLSHENRIKERIQAILKREKDDSGKKIIQETRGKLREFLKQMKPQVSPHKETSQEKWASESSLDYNWVGIVSAKNEEGTMNMRVLGPKFGNNTWEIALGAMYSSQRDRPSWEAEWQIGIGLAGSFKF